MTSRLNRCDTRVLMVRPVLGRSLFKDSFAIHFLPRAYPFVPSFETQCTAATNYRLTDRNGTANSGIVIRTGVF